MDHADGQAVQPAGRHVTADRLQLVQFHRQPDHGADRRVPQSFGLRAGDPLRTPHHRDAKEHHHPTLRPAGGIDRGGRPHRQHCRQARGRRTGRGCGAGAPFRHPGLLPRQRRSDIQRRLGGFASQFHGQSGGRQPQRAGADRTRPEFHRRQEFTQVTNSS